MKRPALPPAVRARLRHECPAARTTIVLAALLAAAAAAAAPARGGETDAVPPARIVEETLAHSPALRLAEEEKTAARAREAGATAAGRPALGIDLGAQHYEGLRDVTLGPVIAIPAIEDRYHASAWVAQPLYTGGRVAARRQGARFERSAAGEGFRAARADAVLDALRGYWSWSQAYYALQARADAVARAEAHAADLENRRKAGLATEQEALAAAVALDRARLRHTEAQRAVDVSRARIAFLTGRELPATARPERADPQPPEVLPDDEAAAREAAARRPELSARGYEADAAAARARAARAGGRPQVSLAARYEQARPNSQFFPPADEWEDDAYAGIAVTWQPFDSGRVQADAREAEARARQARLRLLQAEQAVTLETREALIALRNAFDRIGVAAHGVESARRNLAAATDRWHNGLVRHAEVLDALVDVSEAEYEQVVARADAALAQAAFDHATGRAAFAAPPPPPPADADAAARSAAPGGAKP